MILRHRPGLRRKLVFSSLFCFSFLIFLNLDKIWLEEEAQPMSYGDPPKCYATLVSAYYNISSKHSPEEYLSWMQNFLSIQDCMVVFTTQELVQTIRDLRGPQLPIKIIPRDFKSFRVAQMLDKEGWELQEALDPELEAGHSRELYWIWNEKSEMLRMVTELNPFSSSYFAWLDIGAIRHTWWNGRQMMRHFPTDPGVLLLKVGEFTKADKRLLHGRSHANFFKDNRIGGGMIGGTARYVEEWSRRYYDTLTRYFRLEKFGGKDQSVMATTCLESDICLLLDGTPAWSSSFCNPRWFLLQEYYLGKLEDEPVRLNLSELTSGIED